MKIIRQGTIPHKRFECEYCGCIWETNKGEYEWTPQIARMDGEKPYYMQCPCCKKINYSD